MKSGGSGPQQLLLPVLLPLPVLVQTKNVLLHNKPPVMPSTESVADVAVRLRISHFDDSDDDDEGDHFEMSTAEAEGEEISQLYSATSGQVYRCVIAEEEKEAMQSVKSGFTFGEPSMNLVSDGPHSLSSSSVLQGHLRAGATQAFASSPHFPV